MKYIDSDLLRERIEKNKWVIEPMFVKGDDSVYDGENDAYNRVLRIIDSLQQEQNSAQDTELTYFESALFTAFSYAWQSYLRGEEVNVAQWAKENSAELLEAARFQEEQPEVDLEKYIENEINHYGLSLYEASYGTFSASQIDRIIRNAFELGLKARKEE